MATRAAKVKRVSKTKPGVRKYDISASDELLSMTSTEAQLSAQATVKKYSKIIHALAKL